MDGAKRTNSSGGRSALPAENRFLVNLAWCGDYEAVQEWIAAGNVPVYRGHRPYVLPEIVKTGFLSIMHLDFKRILLLAKAGARLPRLTRGDVRSFYSALYYRHKDSSATLSKRELDKGTRFSRRADRFAPMRRIGELKIG